MRLLVTGGSGFIGSHVARRVAAAAHVEWINLDLRPPVSGEFLGNWRCCDILDDDALEAAIAEFAPTHVLHLAARTDTESQSVWDYRVNTQGTLNVIKSVRPHRVRFVFTSSQYVLRPGVTPVTDTHFDPHTAYGHSKAIGELLTRAGLPESVWTIVRPTNVWGPWHPRYGDEFLSVVRRGLYVHPRRATTRTYGYVTNVVDQMWATLTFPDEAVASRVFYLGDTPLELREWTDAFSRALRGAPVRQVPVAALRALALVGDAAGMFGIRAPLTSRRLRSMTEDYITPTEWTIRFFGQPRVSLADGVEETVRWFRARPPTR